MPDDDRPAPEDVASGADGPVGTDPEHARLIADFAAARVQYQAARAATEPDRKKDAIDALVRTWTRPQAEKRSEAEAAPAGHGLIRNLTGGMSYFPSTPARAQRATKTPPHTEPQRSHRRQNGARSKCAT